jgi:hypothetical protein
VATNLDIVKGAYLHLGTVDENQQPSARLGLLGLISLNEMLATLGPDGIRLGWYTQTDLSAEAPIPGASVGDVKYLLAKYVSTKVGRRLDPVEDSVLIDQINAAETRLRRTSLLFGESDLGELQRPEGGPWGGPGGTFALILLGFLPLHHFLVS